MRSLGLIVFGVIALMVTWSGIKAVQANYALQKQISTLQQQTSIQTLQNNNLKLQNQYLNTPQFLELSARRNFGLAAPGEKELIVPKSVALAHIVSVPGAKVGDVTSDVIVPRPAYQENFQAWINFFLHRPTSQ